MIEEINSLDDLFKYCEDELKDNRIFEFLKNQKDNFGYDAPGGINSLRKLLGEIEDVYKDKQNRD